MDLGLTDRHAIITGGASGIGEATARGFLAEGARVTILDRDRPRGEALTTEFARSSLLFFNEDLLDSERCMTAIRDAESRFGPTAILVNNAGTNDGVGLDASIPEFRESLDNNLVHVFAMMRGCVESLNQSSGAVVNVGSKVSITGQGGTSGYAASKGAMNALTREWALELAPSGVRVNAVIPAEVLTPQYRTWLKNQGDSSTALERIESRIPLGGRMTRPEEVANAIVYLASERASHITGQLLYVDGGYVQLDNARTANRD